MPTHTYLLELYPPDDRNTADSSATSDKPFMPFAAGDLVWLAEAQQTVVVEQILRLIVPEPAGNIVDKLCVYTRQTVD